MDQQSTQIAISFLPFVLFYLHQYYTEYMRQRSIDRYIDMSTKFITMSAVMMGGHRLDFIDTKITNIINLMKSFSEHTSHQSTENTSNE